jgi:uncharacterized Fe-S center protein
MTSKVFWGSPHQTQLHGKETLPAKLDLILEKLELRKRVKDHRVAIKMHLGLDLGYSIVHPVFVRKVVEAVIEGGGKPFVTDLGRSETGAYKRGYSAETLGCPLYPATGIDEKWFTTHSYEYRQMTEFQLGGAIEEATFLIDLAHVKGHPSCSFAGAIKNLALGCVTGKTRGEMHDVCHYEPSFYKDKCPDEKTRIAIRDSCRFGAIVDDKEDPEGLHMHEFNCNQCMECRDVAGEAFVVRRSDFMAFLEVNLIVTKLVLDTFEPGNAVFINLANNLTPVCDCFGFTGLPVLPDAGIFGSDDIIALEQATLDATSKTPIIEENLPRCIKVVGREGHPFQWIHGIYKDPYEQMAIGERMGLGSRKYDLIDVVPLGEPVLGVMPYVPAAE